MRIALDATSLPFQPVGAGNYLIQLIRALAESLAGNELVLFSYPHAKELVGLPETEGIEWVMLSYRKPARRLVWEQINFPSIVAKQRIDVLHSPHYTRPTRLPCASVVTFHDMTFFLYPQMHTRAKRIYFPAAIRSSSKRADRVITVSENTRKDAIRLLGIAPEKITTIYSGVNPEFHTISDRTLLETIRHKYRLPGQFILYVGTIEPRKNVPMLIRAYHRLVSQGIQTPLILVGKNGWMYEEITWLIDQLDLVNRVKLTGYIPAEDLPTVYNLATMFVYPSLYEGFGFPPLEAMACGIPAITSAISAMPEHIGEAGILINPGDETALVEAMRTLLEDATLRQRLAEKGIKQAAQFSWKRTAQETLHVYQQAYQAHKAL